MSHYRDMTREQLVDYVAGMQWTALDLAQHLSFVNELMAPVDDPLDAKRKQAYMQAQRMAYALAFADEAPPQFTAIPGITVFGETGLLIDEGKS